MFLTYGMVDVITYHLRLPCPKVHHVSLEFLLDSQFLDVKHFFF